MTSAIEILARRARRRFLLAYLARGLGWRCMLVLLELLVSSPFASLWALPWVTALALAIDWAVRWRPPTELAAAIEVDRQFGLKELISTGLVAGETDAMSTAARANAENAAGIVDPRRLDGGSFGLRYWIVTLLLAGIVAALPGFAEDRSRPEVLAGDEQKSEESQRHAGETSMPRPASTPRPARPAGAAASDFASSAGELEDGGNAAAADSPTRSESAAKGTGGGLATGGADDASPAAEQRLAKRPGASTAGSETSGAGPAATDDGTAAGSGTISAPDRPIPPTDADQGTATAGQEAAPDLKVVPAAYRDVIKAYYAR